MQVRWNLFLPEGDPVVSDLLSNKKGEIGFCKEFSEVDAREVCGCFGGGIYYFIPRNFPMAGDPDVGYELGDC